MTGLSPFEGETGVSGTPTFSWDPYPGATTYVIWLSDTSGETGVWGIRTLSAVTSIDYGSTSGTILQPPTEYPLLPNTTYGWYLLALDSNNWCISDNRLPGGTPLDTFTTGP